MVKVLIADDENAILEITAKKVQEAGYDVVTARDGQEAWEKIQAEVPDVIVLDLCMPKKDGFEVLRDVRHSPSSAKWQPVIIVSAMGEIESVEKGFALEADHYLVKPCDADAVLQAIRLMAGLIPERKRLAPAKNV